LTEDFFEGCWQLLMPDINNKGSNGKLYFICFDLLPKFGNVAGRVQIVYTKGLFGLMRGGIAVYHAKAAGDVTFFTRRFLYFYFTVCKTFL